MRTSTPKSGSERIAAAVKPPKGTRRCYLIIRDPHQRTQTCLTVYGLSGEALEREVRAHLQGLQIAC
jgi:hypothetical protein